MAIFSRRIIQKLLNENRNFLSPEQTSDHIKKLNSNEENFLAIIWEVIVLNVLSKIGKVTHEKEYKGPRKPDIYFESAPLGTFVADITAISDENYKKENPISYFNECLYNFFKKAELTTKGIFLEIGDQMIGEYGNSKEKLTLPSKNDIPVFIKREFFNIRKAIKEKPNQAFKTAIKKGDISLSVSYTPQDQSSGLSHVSFTVLYSLTNNPIYNRLKKKAEQLKKSKYDGVMGVFICDGDCNSLNNNPHGVGEYSQQDIINEFFRTNKTLSFVVVITPEEKYKFWGDKPTRYIKTSYYYNSKANIPISKSFVNELSKFEKYFPIVESMPANAKNFLKITKNKGRSHYGGFTMGTNEIKISSRMLTELLAGVLDFEKFDMDHKKMNSEKENMIKKFFLWQIKQGSMVDSIRIEKCENEDDDWIKFIYSPFDAAISKFK